MKKEDKIYDFKFQKEGYGEGFFDGQMTERIAWKNKIKAKIEEYKEKQNKYFELNMLNDVIIFQQKIQLLQSLLEKE